MRKKDYKGRCEKRILDKCNSLFKSYDPIQSAYANILVKSKDVAEIQCNVPLDGENCSEYMSDFVCVMVNGDLMVRECVSRAHLTMLIRLVVQAEIVINNIGTKKSKVTRFKR